MSLKFKIIASLSVFVSITWLLLYLVIKPIFPIVNQYYFPQQTVTYLVHKIPVYIHIISACIALMIGWIQFVPSIRDNHKKLHSIIALIYFVAVLVGGFSALYISQFAYAGNLGWTSTIGFATLAILWIFSIIKSYLALKNKEYNRHKRWLLRNYAYTFAAVTLRIYLPFASIDMANFYPLLAWLCWVPNALVINWYIAKFPKTT